MIFATEFDWNSVNFGGVSIGGGLLAFAVFVGPKIPAILEWCSIQLEKKRQFAREKRREDAELTNQLMTILKELAVAGSKQSESLDRIQDRMDDIAEHIRRGEKISLPLVPPPTLTTGERKVE